MSVLPPRFPPFDDGPEDEDPILEGLLAEALARGAEREAAVEEGDPQTEAEILEVVRRWQAGDALHDAALRQRMSEIGEDLAAAEEDVAAGRAAGPSGHVRSAALDAFAAVLEAADGSASARPAAVRASARSGPVSGRAIDVVRSAPFRSRVLPLVYRAAALVLIVLGVAWLTSGRTDAAAGVQLAGVDRLYLDVGGRQMAGARLAPVGELFTADRGQLLGLRLPEDGALVLGRGDRVRVIRGDDAAVGGDAREALFRLESGEARLHCGGAPLHLVVGDTGRLVLLSGEAHVLLDAHGEPAARGSAIALGRGARARFEAADRTVQEWSGPAHVLLTSDGTASLGTPAERLFRELAFFSGALPAPVTERPTGAHLWRVALGTVRRHQGGMHVWPARTEEDEGAAHLRARLAWVPSSRMRRASALRLALRGPGGLRVRIVGGAAISGEAAPGIALPSATGALEPGLGGMEIPLAAGWYDRLGARELILEFEWPAGSGTTGADARGRSLAFEGATFTFEHPDGLRATDVGRPEGQTHEDDADGS